MKHEIDLELIEEMAECIFNCEWVSKEEIASYIKSCVTDSASYTPEEWSADGKELEATDRDIL